MDLLEIVDGYGFQRRDKIVEEMNVELQNLIFEYLEGIGYKCRIIDIGVYHRISSPSTNLVAEHVCKVYKHGTEFTRGGEAEGRWEVYVADVYIYEATAWVARFGLSPLKWVLNFYDPKVTFMDLEKYLQEIHNAVGRK